MKAKRPPPVPVRSCDALLPQLRVPPGLASCSVRHEGEEYLVLSFPTEVSESNFVSGAPWKLTAAEYAIGAAVVSGLSSQAIATERSVSIRTVNNQLSSIYRKLGINSRSELAMLWPAIGGVSSNCP